jgi:hypothetical protein
MEKNKGAVEHNIYFGCIHVRVRVDVDVETRG